MISTLSFPEPHFTHFDSLKSLENTYNIKSTEKVLQAKKSPPNSTARLAAHHHIHAPSEIFVNESTEPETLTNFNENSEHTMTCHTLDTNGLTTANESDSHFKSFGKPGVNQSKILNHSQLSSDPRHKNNNTSKEIKNYNSNYESFTFSPKNLAVGKLSVNESSDFSGLMVEGFMIFS